VTNETLDYVRVIAAHAARCTAPHGVGATPKPAGANIGCAMKVARHSLSQFGLQGNPPCSCAARCVNSLAARWGGCR